MQVVRRVRGGVDSAQLGTAHGIQIEVVGVVAIATKARKRPSGTRWLDVAGGVLADLRRLRLRRPSPGFPDCLYVRGRHLGPSGTPRRWFPSPWSTARVYRSPAKR
jgi:hypothetical protein